jgi:hypothetical protein
MIVARAISGLPKKDGLFHPEERAKPGERAEARLQHRLADHPRHRHGRQHQRHEEGHAKELPRPDLRVQQQRKGEGDGVFHKDRQRNTRPC